MSWSPISDNHAIERTRVSIGFGTPLSQKTMTLLLSVMDESLPKLGFNSKGDVKESEVTVSGSLIHSEQTTGWQFQRQPQPGVTVESLTLTGKNLNYEIAEYSRWEGFLERYLVAITNILNELSTVADVQNVALEYFDRFVFDGAQTGASPETLLSTEFLNVLSEPAKSGRELWHLHRGWFEGEGVDRVLVNQNFDAQHGKKPTGEAVSSVAVVTKVEKQNIWADIDLKEINTYLERMHVISGEVFRKQLHDSVKNRIGLK